MSVFTFFPLNLAHLLCLLFFFTISAILPFTCLPLCPMICTVLLPSSSSSPSLPLPLCLFSGLKRGVCSQINHFPDDADYDQDAAEYLLREWHTHIYKWTTNAHRHTHTHTHSACTSRCAYTHLNRTQRTYTHHSLHHTRIQKGQKGMVGGHQCTDVRFKQSVPGDVCVSVQCVYVCLNAQVHGVGSLGVYRKLFFADGLKEQPSLMDYFQLRIQVSHPASIVIANSVRTALNLLVYKVYVPSIYYVKISISVKEAMMLS